MKNLAGHALVCLLGAALMLTAHAPTPVSADGEKPAKPGARLSIPETVAVIPALVKAGDTAALALLANRDAPDPWLVASRLCAAGHGEEAEAFARAATARPAVDGLAAFLSKRRQMPSLAAAWQALLALDKLEPRKALAHAPDPLPPTTSVVGILLLARQAELHHALGDHQAAAEAAAASVEAAEGIGWRRQVGYGAQHLGTLHMALGNRGKAKTAFQRALSEWSALQDSLGIGGIQEQLAQLASQAGEKLKYIGLQEAALRAYRKAASSVQIAITSHRLGLACADVARYRKALTYYDHAYPLYMKLGHRAHAAAILLNKGLVYAELGMYAKALACYEEGVRGAKEERHQQFEGNGLLNLAGLHWRMGNLERARSLTEKALATMKRAGRLQDTVLARIGIGILLRDEQEYEESKKLLTQAIAQAEFMEMEDAKWNATQALGRTLLAMGQVDAALALFESALEAAEKSHRREDSASLQGSIGAARLAKGEHKKATAVLLDAARAARRLHSREQLLFILDHLVAALLMDGKPERAMALAREAGREMESVLLGLGINDAVTSRGRYADLFLNGALAAARAGHDAEALDLLETGRAGALLQLLGGRNALEWSTIPEELLHAEADARQREARAREAIRAASAKTDFAGTREATRLLEDAEARVLRVTEEIFQHAQKASGALIYPRAVPLEELQDALHAGEALVLYGTGDIASLAMVVTKASCDVVELVNEAALAKACAALDASDPAVDVTAVVKALRRLVVDPLKLPEKLRRVIISPQGPLGTLPFALLFDAPTVMTPSASTLVHLRGEKHARGSGVLALGDPAYGSPEGAAGRIYLRGADKERGGLLDPLPSSGDEARQVGTLVLTGTKATESGLRKALSREKRWRAVHLACHGLIDTERPLRSCLALAREEKEDGFLTMIEVLRMDVTSDLAVLSACETGKGRVASGEGLIGLTRAFMCAGSERVLCSLWKVDDEATGALMKAFYRFWNPEKTGEAMPAAAALRRAQAEIRKIPKWKHPYYWSGWALWGEPR